MTAAELAIEPVARRLLGKPTSASKTELRHGNNGSLSIDLRLEGLRDR